MSILLTQSALSHACHNMCKGHLQKETSLQVQAKIHHRLPFRTEPYLLTLHLGGNSGSQQGQQQQDHSVPSISLASTPAPSELAAAERAPADDDLLPEGGDLSLPDLSSEPLDELDGAAPAHAPHAGRLPGSQADLSAHAIARSHEHLHNSDPQLWAATQRGQVAPSSGSGGAGWQGPACACVQERGHKLQTWFGAGAVLSLVPMSYSRRILNEQVPMPPVSGRPRSACTCQHTHNECTLPGRKVRMASRCHVLTG